jgi:4-hydroxybenzoate polyprenyltransferase
MSLSYLGLTSGLVDLNTQGRYLTVGWLSISWANAVVIALMLVTFVVALLLPFPRGRR